MRTASRGCASIASNAPAAHQRLDGAPVDDALVDAAAEIEQVRERAAGLARAATIALMAASPVPLTAPRPYADAASRRPARSGSSRR